MVGDHYPPRSPLTGKPSLGDRLGKSMGRHLKPMGVAIMQTETMPMTIDTQTHFLVGVLMKVTEMRGGLFSKRNIQTGIVWKRDLLAGEGPHAKTNLQGLGVLDRKETLWDSGVVKRQSALETAVNTGSLVLESH